MDLAHISTLVAHYGYLATFVAVLLASAGAPLPAGELLIAATVYAADTHRLSLAILVAVGALAAMLGGAAGYGLGRSVGAVTLARFGGYVGLNAARIRLGQYLFIVHGGKIVFFLRFVALVGPFGGVLAGANRMKFGRFMIFNALGAIAWTCLFGIGGYLFGAFFAAAGRVGGIAAVLLTIALILGLLRYIHGREAELQAKADGLLLTRP